MALSQLYTAIAGDVITAARWNNEFGNIYVNGTDVAFPLTKAVSYAGYTVTYDVAGVSTITSPSTTGFVFTIGVKSGSPGPNGSLGVVTASTFTDTATAAAGTASLWTGFSIRTPTLAATNAVTTTNATTLYIEGPPATGSNETITSKYAVFAGAGMIAAAKGSDIASAASIAVTSPFSDVTGTTAISSISTAFQAGTIFKLRFTGAGLNITYNATSMISPWAVDYLTVPNEIIEFISLGSGNYIFYSLNGPTTRTGETIEHGSSTTPAGFLPEDGASLLRASYPGLFAVIGTTYGSADGTHFNVPLTLGLVAINRDPANSVITAASTNGANAATLGGKGGAETHTLTTPQIPSHNHGVDVVSGGVGSVNGFAGPNADVGNDTTNNTGGGGAHSNTQPYIAKAKFIRF